MRSVSGESDSRFAGVLSVMPAGNEVAEFASAEFGLSVMRAISKEEDTHR
jgi:hypothetical protein